MRRKAATWRAVCRIADSTKGERQYLNDRFQYSRMTSGDVEAIANPKDAEDRKLGHAVRSNLNAFEQLALGVQLGIFDEDVVRTMAKTITKNTWDVNRPFTEKIRETNPRAMEALEALHDSFSDSTASSVGKVEKGLA